ncbi:chaperonin 10-like protein [Aspergillus ambiguus]|uniref:zinc-binding alcohol dehydrogenase family protein n=1 Tax=Aspergillus ambiguus TaxID=176160 RepID=UPI003CCE45EB
MTAITTYNPLGHLVQKDFPTLQQEAAIEQRSSVYAPKTIIPQACRQTQQALLLKRIREPYTLVHDHEIPSLSSKDEILVKIQAIGLNPVDWKGPAFNFGIPSLPWINGRDFAGVVVKTHESSRLRVGDTVLVPSTDYRDIRKAAFQEYAIATHYNAARIPSGQCLYEAASLGVAFVASAMALGVSLGLDFSQFPGVPGPDLNGIINRVNKADIPTDIINECYSGSDEVERLKRGQWIAIWGASTTTGYITLQLAKMAGLRVICVADIARHGSRLLELGADILVDRYDTERAAEIIRGVTKDQLRYAIDIVGENTAAILQKVLDSSIREDGSHAHLLGLTGLPKARSARIVYHTVPIKLFHACPAIGSSMMTWLEDMLGSGAIKLPEIIRKSGGLGSINAALEFLRLGAASGKRVVIDLAA